MNDPSTHRVFDRVPAYPLPRTKERIMQNLSAWQSEHGAKALAVLRVVVGLLFLAHGVQKLFVFPVGTMPPPPALSLFWFAGLIELVCGALLIAGIFTRAAALLASGEMAVAYWMMHAPQSFYPVNNGGDAAILFCFVFAYFAVAGPGDWSLDGAIAKAREHGAGKK